MANRKIDWEDVALHLLGAGVIAVSFWLPPKLGGYVFATALGVYKEWHENGPPIGWSRHVWAEALAWPLGAFAIGAVLP
jgi:hypothetical protein